MGTRRNEVRKYVEDHLTDISIGRESRSCRWGSPLGHTQRIYVWFDALLNYMTAVGYGTNEELFRSIGRGSSHDGEGDHKFHCALWPR